VRCRHLEIDTFLPWDILTDSENPGSSENSGVGGPSLEGGMVSRVQRGCSNKGRGVSGVGMGGW